MVVLHCCIVLYKCAGSNISSHLTSTFFTQVSVKFAEKHIKGSPYSVKITGEGRKRNQISVGSQSEVSLPGKVTDSDIKSLNASIQAPSGLEEPCFLKKLPNGHLGRC